MAETGITIKPQSVVTSEAPQSHVSGADIESSYALLGAGLDKLGESFEKVAEPLAEHAGLEAGQQQVGGSVAPQQAQPQPIINAPVSVYQASIDEAAKKYNLDPAMFGRQLYQESGFNPRAVSPAGAKGIAQFMDATAQRYNVADPFNPGQAIPGAAAYMSDLHQQFGGNSGLALAAYNWGEGNVARWQAAGGNPAAMPRETRNYVQAISGKSIEQWTGQPAAAFNPPAASETGSTVSRDDQGNLQVTHAPIFGEAGAIYARAVKFSALAQGEAEAKRQDLLLSKQFHEDPDGYLAASKAFRDNIVGEYKNKFGPEVAISLQRGIDNATTYNYRWLVLEQQRNIKQNFDRDTKSAIQTHLDDVESTIASGGLENPEGQKAVLRGINEIHSLYNERVNSPVLHASAEEARYQLQQIDLRIGAAKFTYGVNKALRDPMQGPMAAQQMLEDHLRDEKVPMAQRQIDYATGLGAIKQFTEAAQRTRNLTKLQQDAVDKDWEDRIIGDTEGKITDYDIRTNTLMSPESKMKMLRFRLSNGMQEPSSAESHSTTIKLLSQIRATDDSRLKDNGPIYDALTNRQINRQDFDFLRKEFEDTKTPEGQAIASDRKIFFERYASSVDAGMNMEGAHSELGSQRLYAFEMDARRQERQLQAQGKDPHALYDPNSPMFLGKQVGKYHASLQEIQQYRKGIETPQPAQPTPQRVQTMQVGNETARLAPDGNYYVERDGKFHKVNMGPPSAPTPDVPLRAQ